MTTPPAPAVTWRCACGHEVALPARQTPSSSIYCYHAAGIDEPYHSGPWTRDTGQQQLPLTDTDTAPREAHGDEG